MVFPDDDEKPTFGEDGHETIEVNLDPSDDDDDSDEDIDDEVAGGFGADPEVSGRQQRRRERSARRYKDMRDRVEASDERSDRLERELEQVKAQAAQSPTAQQVQGYVQQQRGPQVDPIDREINRTFEEINNNFQRFQDRVQNLSRDGKEISPEERKKFDDRARQLDLHKTKLVAKQMLQQGGAGQQQQGVDPNQIRQQVLQAQMQSKYPGVFADNNAMKWANARHYQLMAEGMDDSPATAEQALKDARRQFSTGDPDNDDAPEPTDADRRRFASPSGGARPGKGGGSRKRVTLNRAEMGMADTMYPHIKDDRERYTHFARNVIGDRDRK